MIVSQVRVLLGSAQSGQFQWPGENRLVLPCGVMNLYFEEPVEKELTTQFEESSRESTRDLLALIEIARRTAMREGLNLADADDVASATILSYLEAVGNVHFPSAWVCLVARRQAWSMRRKLIVRRRYEDEQAWYWGPPRRHDDESPERQLDAKIAFVSLAPSERTVLLSRDVAGDSLKVIAENTGRSVETIKRRIRRGRESFARALAGRSVRASLHAAELIPQQS